MKTVLAGGLQNRGVGVAAIPKDVEWTRRAGRIAVNRLAESHDLLGGAPGKTSLTAGAAIGGMFFGGGFGRGLDGRRCVDKTDWRHAALSVWKGGIGGKLQDALRPHEVGLEVRAKRIAAPADAGDTDAGLAEERVIDGHTEGRLGRELLQHGAANDREDLRDGEARLGEEPVIGRPIVELLSRGGEQARHGVTSEAEQAAQREGLGAFGDALLGEGGEAFAPELLDGGEEAGGVFFRTEGGGLRRRRASKLLSSMDHSTVSPREKSMACATAEGKLMYHCSLDLRLMSWTLVGRPISEISS